MKVNGIGQSLNLSESKNVKKNDISFGEYLKNSLDSINDAQVKADEEMVKFMAGEEEDIHDVLIATEEARLQLELAVQVRNKLIDSYQEIMRTQI